MADVKIYPDEIRAYWELKQPNSTSGAEREDAAIHALEEKGSAMVDGWNSSPSPQKYEYYNVKLLRIEDEGSETHHDPITQVNSHRAWGTGVGKLEYTLK